MQKRKIPTRPNQRAKLIADMVLGEAEPGRLPRSSKGISGHVLLIPAGSRTEGRGISYR